MNAKQEFIKLAPMEEIICAYVCSMEYSCDEDHEPRHYAQLKKGFTKEEYDAFLEKLDFEYDAGYGLQKLDGCVWCVDGAWFDRGEYDGSEWWNYHRYPQIPETLL